MYFKVALVDRGFPLHEGEGHSEGAHCSAADLYIPTQKY